jgi:hypothetical protein
MVEAIIDLEISHIGGGLIRPLCVWNKLKIIIEFEGFLFFSKIYDYI